MVLPIGDVERSHRVPIVTYGLIVLNILAFLYQSQKGELWTISHAATPVEITRNVDLAEPIPVTMVPASVPVDMREEYVRQHPAELIPQAPVGFPVRLTLLTCMFLHGGIMHLLGNMLYLWIFGDNVEDVFGHALYLVVYLLSGLAGSIAHIAVDPDSPIPTLGASGAIAGVMGAYLVWFPFNRVRVLVIRFIVLVPAIVVIGLWVVMQIAGSWSSATGDSSGGVAYLAHLGGAVVGAIFAILFLPRARAHKELMMTRVGWLRPDQRYRIINS